MKATGLAALVLAVMLPTGSAAAPKECDTRDLKISLELNQQSYATDQPVRMKMVVVNKGPTCTMVWSDGQTHAFYVFDDGKKIWSSDACKVYSQAVVEKRWEKGHREVYRKKWNQSPNNRREECGPGGEKVEPGSYEAEGHFMGEDGRRTGKLTFHISG